MQEEEGRGIVGGINNEIRTLSGEISSVAALGVVGGGPTIDVSHADDVPTGTGAASTRWEP